MSRRTCNPLLESPWRQGTAAFSFTTQ